MLLLAAFPLIAACTPNAGVDGPCVHSYLGPVLTLKEATLDGRPVQQVEIVRVRQGSYGFDLAAELDSSDSTGLEVGPGGDILCTLPCGFGEKPGRWRVRIAGPDNSQGFVDTQAEYSDGSGGCPSYSSDGSQIAVTLTVRD